MTFWWSAEHVRIVFSLERQLDSEGPGESEIRWFSTFLEAVSQDAFLSSCFHDFCWFGEPFGVPLAPLGLLLASLLEVS